MITEEPFRYTGTDIEYPDVGSFVEGKLEIYNYPPEVLRRGFGDIGILSNKLEPKPPFNWCLIEPDTPIFQCVTSDGLAARLGLSHVDAQHLHDSAVELARLLYREEISEDERTERTALLGYLAIAEAQTLIMANKRVGRAIYGRLRYGYGPNNIKRGVDAVLDDTVPDEVERLVLLQNIVRCRDDAEPIPIEFGGVYIDTATMSELDGQYRLLDSYRRADNTSTYLDDFSFNRYQLSQQLNTILCDEKLANRVSHVLIQKDYGPAAWLLCCKDMPLEKLTPDIANKLIATSTRLL